MKRKVKEYSERKAEFLEIGMEMFFRNGYANTSVNDIIKRIGVAKGTFYHYFESKDDLLDSIVDDFSRKMISKVDDIINNPRLGAIEKFNSAYNSIRELKFENMELMIVLMNVLYSDENIILRHKMFKQTIQSLSPKWAEIIEQGIKEGVFNCPSPLETSEYLFAISTYLNEEIVHLLSMIKETPEVVIEIKKKIIFFQNTIERLLGAEEGSISVFDTIYLDKFMISLKKNNE